MQTSKVEYPDTNSGGWCCLFANLRDPVSSFPSEESSSSPPTLAPVELLSCMWPDSSLVFGLDKLGG